MSSREPFDILFDNIVGRLESAATTEAGAEFVVKPDNLRAIGESQYPAWVLPRLDRTDFEAGQSAVGEEFGMSVVYAIDCIVRSGKTSDRAGREAFARLRYLVTQVVRTLWSRDAWDLGLAYPISRALPSIVWAEPEIQTGEKAIIGATVELEVGLAWRLEEPTGSPLTELEVALADRWAGLYEYGE
jgi:hypothetical protein